MSDVLTAAGWRGAIPDILHAGTAACRAARFDEQARGRPPHAVVAAPASRRGVCTAATAELARVAAEAWDGQTMTAPLGRHICQRAKSDQFFPEALIKQAFVADYLDIAGAAERFRAVWDAAGSTFGSDAV